MSEPPASWRDTGAPAEQVAAHLLQVPHRGAQWVVEVLRTAATTAADRGAPDAATRYLDRAMAEPPAPEARTGILLELGRLQTMADGRVAVIHLREAYQLIADPPQRAEIAQMMTRSLVFAGAPGEATAFAARAADELPAELVDERQGLRALGRIAGYLHGIDPRIWRVGDPAIVGEGPGARMLAATLAWETMIDGIDRDRAVELARFALAGGTLMEVDTGLLWVVACLVLHAAGEDAMPVWEESLAHAHQRGSAFAAIVTHLWRGYVEWDRGDLPAALASVMLAHEQSWRIWGPNVGLPYPDLFAIGIRVDQGDLVGARTLLEEARDTLRFGDGIRLFGEVDASLLIAEGRYEEALPALDAIDPVLNVPNPAWRRERSLRARALAGLGERAQAVALLQEELQAARAWGTPELVGRTLCLLGEITGDADHLRAAVELLAGSRARLEYARALAALGEYTADGRALLKQAYELADRCGAHGLRSALASRLGVVQ